MNNRTIPVSGATPRKIGERKRKKMWTTFESMSSNEHANEVKRYQRKENLFNF